MRRLKARLAWLLGRPFPLTAMVTGSNGKTTTVNMLAHVLGCAGHRVGMANTEGVYLDGKKVWNGDASGYRYAGWVVTEAGISAAVLETARGGLLTQGLYLQECDVAALTSIGYEHLGELGVETPQDMARVKKRVLDAARRAVVINADNPYCLGVSGDYPPAKKIMFGLDANSPAVDAHLAAGGRAICLSGSGPDATIGLRKTGRTQEIIAVSDIPATQSGMLRFNIANAMAAIGLAIGLGLSHDDIRRGLRSFSLNTDNPGRFNLLTDRLPHILVNYGSNPIALRETIPAIHALPCRGRSHCLITAPDNRIDTHYPMIAEELAGHFDDYAIFAVDRYARKHEPAWVPERLKAELIAAGIPPEQINGFSSLDDALRAAAAMASKDDLIVVFGETMGNTIGPIDRHFGK